MNQSFENIFEKYNILSERPRKRQRSRKALTQSQSTIKNQLTIEKILCETGSPIQKRASAIATPKATISLNFNSSCYINTNTRGKYIMPTRYKILDIIPVGSKYNCTSEISFSDSEYVEKENYICTANKKVESQLKRAVDTQSNIKSVLSSVCVDDNVLPDRFGTNTFEKYINNDQHDILPLQKATNFNVSFREGRNLNSAISYNSDCFLMESFQSLEKSFTSPAEAEDNLTVFQKPIGGTSTELDLLIDLIQNEDKNKKKAQTQFSNSKNNLSRSKSCLKGGYEEMFQRALKQEKVKSNFLKYDKKMGLSVGQLLTVVNIESSYGLTLATVKSENLSKNFAIAVSEEMSPRLKLGSEVEAFFDEHSFPYKLQLNGEYLDVYLEPYKLLIV